MNTGYRFEWFWKSTPNKGDQNCHKKVSFSRIRNGFSNYLFEYLFISLNFPQFFFCIRYGNHRIIKTILFKIIYIYWLKIVTKKIPKAEGRLKSPNENCFLNMLSMLNIRNNRGKNFVIFIINFIVPTM